MDSARFADEVIPIAQVLAVLLHELRGEGRDGLKAMCIGDGQGTVAILERA